MFDLVFWGCWDKIVILILQYFKILVRFVYILLYCCNQLHISLLRNGLNGHNIDAFYKLLSDTPILNPFKIAEIIEWKFSCFENQYKINLKIFEKKFKYILLCVIVRTIVQKYHAKNYPHKIGEFCQNLYEIK